MDGKEPLSERYIALKCFIHAFRSNIFIHELNITVIGNDNPISNIKQEIYISNAFRNCGCLFSWNNVAF